MENAWETDSNETNETETNETETNVILTVSGGSFSEQVPAHEATDAIERIASRLNLVDYIVKIDGEEKDVDEIDFESLTNGTTISVEADQIPKATLKVAGEEPRRMPVEELTADFVKSEARRKEWKHATIKKNGVVINSPNDFVVAANDTVSIEAYVKWG